MTLKNTTAEILGYTLDGILLAYGYNEPIDESYCLEFKIEDKETFFKVSYKWIMGVIQGSNASVDPTIAVDDKPVYGKDRFKVFKTESLRKFTKEVIDAIDEVTRNKFDDNIED